MTLQEAMSGITDALRPLQAVIPDLQVYGYWNSDPTPPSLDVYPGNPFQDGAAFGVGQSRVYFTVRARVGMDDPESGMQLLLRLLDPHDAASVEAALADVAVVTAEGVNGFTQYADDMPGTVRMIGSEWTVSTFL